MTRQPASFQPDNVKEGEHFQTDNRKKTGMTLKQSSERIHSLEKQVPAVWNKRRFNMNKRVHRQLNFIGLNNGKVVYSLSYTIHSNNARGDPLL